MKRKQNKNSLGVSALQIIVALSLMSMSAVLLASGFRFAPSGGGGRSVGAVNPAPAGTGQAAAPRPAVISPFSDDELAAQAAIEAEMREAERARQSGLILPETPPESLLEPEPPEGVTPALQPYWQARSWAQRGSPVLRDASEWQALQAEAAIQSALEWVPIPQARPKLPQVTCMSMVTGNWSSTGTWSCGHVPTSSDDAVIATGTVVTIDTAAVALDVTVNSGGVLQYDPATARSLTLGGNATVSLGGTFQAGLAGVTHTLSIGGNLANNGTINFSQTAVVAVTFTSASSATWTGDGNYNLTAAGGGVTINKGTSSASVLTFTPGLGVFTVDGSTSNGFLTLTNGTFEIAGANTFSNNVFPTAAYTIPATGGFRLNDANATVNGQNGSPTNNGLLRVSAGTFNLGTVGANVMGAGTGASFTVEGGVMNVAGRLTTGNTSPPNPVTYTQSGGTVNVCTAGGCTTAPSFGFPSTLPKNFFNMSGGTIALVQANTAMTAPVDWSTQGTINYTGGTLSIGAPGTPSSTFFKGQGNMPGLVFGATGAGIGLTGVVWCYGDVTIPSGSAILLGIPTINAGFPFNMLGGTFTNNGQVAGGSAFSLTADRLQFAGATAQTYTGTGTFGTSASPIFAFGNMNRGSGLTINGSVTPIYTSNLLAFTGSLTNANTVSLAQGGTIQRGGLAQLPAGTLDVSPSYTGSPASVILSYAQASNAVTTSVEVPSGRTAASIQVFNTNGVTIAGGPITVTGAGSPPGLFLGGTTAGLAGGPLNTSSANLLTVAGTATSAIAGGSENSYVNGPLAVVLPGGLVTGSTYLFPVGKSVYKAFELVNPTTGAGTVTVQAEVFDTGSGGTAGSGLDAINNNRYWNAQLTGGSVNFTGSDVRVTELNSTGNALGRSSTQTGSYASIGGTLLPATVQSTTHPTALGFFAVGRVAGTLTFPGGTYTVCPSGCNYANLTAAMADLSGKIIIGPILYSLTSTYDPSTGNFSHRCACQRRLECY